MYNIYVLENSWCIVGKTIEDTETHAKLNDAWVIRRWGTDAGIGQLAIEGLRDETTLDPLPDGTIILKRNAIFISPCTHEQWQEDGYPTAWRVENAIK